MKKISLLLIISITVVSSLSGCAWFSANIPTAEMDVQSVTYLNPDINGQASPVALTIYQLSKPDKFNQASYIALENNSSAVLGDDLIDKNIIEIRPKTTMHISEAISEDTHYIGIIAGYQNQRIGNWRHLIKCDTTANKNINLKILLESHTLSVKTN